MGEVKENMGNDLTQGSVSKTLIRFSLPLVGAYLLQSLYSIVDMLIVSHMAGTYSASAVNIVGQISQVVLGIAYGFLSGATVMIAQYLGAGKKDKMDKAIQTGFGFTLFLSVIITVCMLVLTKPILNVLQTPTECYNEAFRYYVIYMAGTIFVVMYNAISSVLRGMGDSKNPLYFVVVSTVINVILDLIFVGPLQWGAAGAALATVIAQALSVIISIFYLKKKGFGFNFLKLSNYKMDKEQVKLMIQLGIPVALQETLLNTSLVVLIGVANSLGVYASAAVGFGAKINVIFILPVCALHVALATMVGQNIGANRMDRAMEATKLEFIYTACYSAIICAVMFVFSKELLMIFTNDPQTLAVGANYFKGHCWDYLLLMPLGYCFGGLFTGTGHTSYVAIANGAGALISRIPLSIFLARTLGLGVLGIGIAYPISTLVTDLVYFGFFLKGDWKNTAIASIKE